MMKNAAMAGLLFVMVFAVVSCSNDDSTGSKDSTPPRVEIQTPWDGSQREGIIDVMISATDEAGIQRVEFYANNTLVGTDTTAPYELEWDLTGYADGTALEIYAKAVDVNGNAKETTPWTMTKGPSSPPVATLTSPSSGWSVMQGYLTTFTGSATDLEDGTITNENITWSSNLQGALKFGTEVNYRGLVIGEHVITMTATDSDGNTDSKSITITVIENDQDYAYIQDGEYTIGPPLFDPVTVIITRPFIIAKKELSLEEFHTNLDLDIDILNSSRDIERRYREIEDVVVDAEDKLKPENYGEYPAVFYTIHEFICYCESLNDAQGLNRSYDFFTDNEPASRPSRTNKGVLKTRENSSYDLNGWRLPTEAEWVIAASGGDSGRLYPWGNDQPSNKCNSMNDPNPPNMLSLINGRGTVPVDSYAEYANPYGIINMAGNAAEMVSDIYRENIPAGSDPVGFTEDKDFEYLVKGGAWYGNSLDMRIGSRMMWIPYEGKPDSRNVFDAGMGARICRSLRTVTEDPWQ